MDDSLTPFIERRRVRRRFSRSKSSSPNDDSMQTGGSNINIIDNNKRICLINKIRSYINNERLSSELRQEISDLRPGNSYPIGRLQSILRKVESETRFQSNTSIAIGAIRSGIKLIEGNESIKKATRGLPEMLDDPQFQQNLKSTLHSVPLIHQINPERLKANIYGDDTHSGLPWYLILGGIVTVMVIILIVFNFILESDNAQDQSVNYFKIFNKLIAKDGEVVSPPIQSLHLINREEGNKSPSKSIITPNPLSLSWDNSI